MRPNIKVKLEELDKELLIILARKLGVKVNFISHKSIIENILLKHDDEKIIKNFLYVILTLETLDEKLLREFTYDLEIKQQISSNNKKDIIKKLITNAELTSITRKLKIKEIKLFITFGFIILITLYSQMFITFGFIILIILLFSQTYSFSLLVPIISYAMVIIGFCFPNSELITKVTPIEYMYRLFISLLIFILFFLILNSYPNQKIFLTKIGNIFLVIGFLIGLLFYFYEKKTLINWWKKYHYKVKLNIILIEFLSLLYINVFIIAGNVYLKDNKEPVSGAEVKLIETIGFQNWICEVTKRKDWLNKLINSSSIELCKTKTDKEGKFILNVLSFSKNIKIQIMYKDREYDSSPIRLGDKNIKISIRNEETAFPTSQSISPETKIDLGTYHALLIAIQDYQYFRPLDYPIKDAKKLKKILTRFYTFEEQNIIFLKNSDRKEIITTLYTLQNKLTHKDNLLIFYAGHGSWDEKMEQGFWIPPNASTSDRDKWIPNSTIRDYIRGIKTQHTLLISDACFSGSILRVKEAFSASSKAIREIYKLKSRRAITSGAMETVPDKSVFLKYIIRRLKDNEERYFGSRKLYDDILYPVIHNSPKLQKPLDGVILGTDDENGDFVFVRRGSEP